MSMVGSGHELAFHCSMNSQAEALQRRARAFVVAVGRFCESLPRADLVKRVIPQLLDAAASANSNYNSACRARSRREFAAKLGVAAEEASEALEWLVTLREAGFGDPPARDALIAEANELTAIFTASHRTVARRR
jgi:four helix bundle protein